MTRQEPCCGVTLNRIAADVSFEDGRELVRGQQQPPQTVVTPAAPFEIANGPAG